MLIPQFNIGKQQLTFVLLLGVARRKAFALVAPKSVSHLVICETCRLTVLLPISPVTLSRGYPYPSSRVAALVIDGTAGPASLAAAGGLGSDGAPSCPFAAAADFPAGSILPRRVAFCLAGPALASAAGAAAEVPGAGGAALLQASNTLVSFGWNGCMVMYVKIKLVLAIAEMLRGRYEAGPGPVA